MVISIASIAPDEDASADLEADARFFGLSPQRPARAIEYSARSHPPRPVFLLNCANLN